MPLSTQFEQVNDYVQKNFASLSEAQLNWKPSPKSWSVAQCLEHLIINNTKYFATFDAVISGTYRQGLWKRTSPFTSFFDKKLLEFTAPDVTTKVKTPPSFSPASSLLRKDVIERFLQQQQKLIQYFDKLETISNQKKIIISSPGSSLITFRLHTLLTAFINHEHRHIKQAENVMRSHQFPKL